MRMGPCLAGGINKPGAGRRPSRLDPLHDSGDLGDVSGPTEEMFDGAAVTR